MKVCTVCGKTKKDSEFFFRNKQAEKLHTQCKQCYADRRRNTWKEHYHRHGSEYRQRAVERNKGLKIKLRKLQQEFLQDKACVKCGVRDPRVLEFDHVEPANKSFEISRAINSTFSWERILAEIEKCQILCANCHKIKTASEAGWYKNLA